MRPLKLELTAFGPFAHTEAIDFRVLGERRLFLVHGPTGAGKTTLLDAICFALYGDATGAERDGKGFRSQFAGPERLTSVTLDFSLGERVYRVTRQPEQERAKLRGEGTTTSPAAATLWDRTDSEDAEDEGRVVATRASQVTEAVADLLGFRSEQFRQVIVLPQGRFRDLLLAKSKEREEILRQLFDTAFYGRVEDALKGRSRELKTEADNLRAQRAALLGQQECADEGEVDALLRQLETEKLAADARIDALQQQSSAASRALERARAQHTQFEKLARAERVFAELRARAPEMERARARLAAARRAAGLADLAAGVADRRAGAASAATGLENLRRKHAAAADAAQSALARLQAERGREPARDALRARLADLERVLPLVSKLAELLEQQAKIGAREGPAAARVDAARRAVATRRDQAAELRRAREVGSAALLAAALRPGEPCPVCGSVEHPRKASGASAIPSPEGVAGAEQAVQAAEAGLEAALEAQRGVERALVGLDADVTALKRQLEGLVEPSLGGVRDARQETERLRADCRQAQAALESAVEAEQVARERRIALAAACEAAMAQHETSAQALDTALAEWRKRLEKSGFADEQAYLEARMPEAELDPLHTAIERFDHDLARAQALAEEARAAVEGLEPPELAAVEAAAAAAAQAYRAAADESGRLASHSDALRSLLMRLGEIGAAYRDTEARFGVFGTLASVAAGDNPHRVSLQRFVLASRLDDVLAAASLRLGTMSRGRYLLRRNTDTADRRSAGGLELEVEDAYTANTRPVTTLSGGESFQAALALALGLSEVVQAYAGGIRLDTIFIDEGFGSLDPEALDLAIDTLLALQESGRMVGVISHVPELRERIDVRLEVAAGPAGSRAAFHLP
ncbi:MAG: AAA family ATPase [Gammaproteobacteria bacterium]